MLTTTQDNEEIIERVAALDIGKAELMCCVRVPDEDHPGQAAAGGAGLSGHDPLGAEAGRSPGPPGRHPGGHGGDSRLLEAGVLPAGGSRVRDVAGQRQGRQAPARPAQDRQAGLSLAVQGRRAADAPPELRAAPADPQAAGPDPVPRRPGRRPDRGEAAGREATGGCLHQGQRGRL